MEGELPTAGDERKLRNLHSVPRPEVSVESTSNLADDAHSLERVSEADFKKTLETLEKYLALRGMPVGVPDLSVAGAEMQKLQGSSWGASLTVHFPEDSTVHPGLRDLVERNLAGRDPFVTMDKRSLTADFLLPDESDSSFKVACEFGYSLALLLGGVPLVSIGFFDPDEWSTS